MKSREYLFFLLLVWRRKRVELGDTYVHGGAWMLRLEVANGGGGGAHVLLHDFADNRDG